MRLARSPDEAHTQEIVRRTRVATPSKDGLDPDKTLVIVGETGVYKLTADQWQKKEDQLPDDSPALGVVNELVNFGTYLACVKDLAVSYRTACTIVNVRAILKNNKSAGISTDADSEGPDSTRPKTT